HPGMAPAGRGQWRTLTLLWAHWMFAEPLTPMLLGGLLLSLAGLGWLYRAERR
ncbi:hypothetical protein UJL90_32115, partial [Pseudomonas aeruginosa]|nr:hypothetical protein [Pseudomonas aeruginosa]